VLERLNRANRTAVFLTTAVVVVLALLLPGWAGALPLLALAAGLVLLARLTWRHTRPAHRVFRAVVLVALVVTALVKAL
jgi:MFS superfamily sulfate permease-like transporter